MKKEIKVKFLKAKVFIMFVAIMLTQITTSFPASSIDTNEIKVLGGIDISEISNMDDVNNYISVNQDFLNEIKRRHISGENYTQSSPLHIKCAEELAAFSEAVNCGIGFQNEYIVLDNDIDLCGQYLDTVDEEDKNDGSVYVKKILGKVKNLFTPIGSFNEEDETKTSSFNGFFCGNNHQIKNLVSVISSEDSLSIFSGLFGCTGEGAKIKDVGIGEGSQIIACSKEEISRVGGLIGICTGHTVINNCYSLAEIKSSGFLSIAGGLVGENLAEVLIITNSYTKGDIVLCANQSFSFGGGIIGRSKSDKDDNKSNVYIINCSSASDVSTYCSSISGPVSGGIIGVADNNAKVLIANSYTSGNIKSLGNGLGSSSAGLVGALENSRIDIKNCYSTGEIVSSCSSSLPHARLVSVNSIVGGLVGLINNNCKSNIRNSYSTSNMFCFSLEAECHCGATHSSSSVIPFYTYVGGLVGMIVGTYEKAKLFDFVISNSYSDVKLNIVGFSNILGGIIGFSDLDNMSISSCYWSNSENTEMEAIGHCNREQHIVDSSSINSAQMKETCFLESINKKISGIKYIFKAGESPTLPIKKHLKDT